ncbi:c-type cytochrome [Rhodovibrio salinarum]|uniref:Cytochrome c domain-containing protein n=1 Tax=Rhodovibrio salinarum TaxID=1087 RepID=A0A934QFH5_9PROT|nr:c-type cytochrome [Rhodovibrio salinarum]MBK1695944.1 hypothetical protein [Rhodovibrio salinarum]
MSLELNKIAAAVLTGGVVAMASGFVADLLVSPHAPEEPVYTVATKEGSGGGSGGSGGSGGEEQAPDLATLLANASASEGESGVRACQACHSFEEGGANKVGPHLFNVVGREIASVDGFGYSSALKGKEGEWTYKKLDAWLENPSGWASGTSMSYPGIKDAEKRADVILYLREQSNNPPPLPEPEQQSADASGSDEGANGEQASDSSGDTQSGDSGSGDSGAGETQSAKADASGGGSGGGSELEQQIASADPSAGKSAVAVCSACHSFEKGGPNKVGPNLYNVLNHKIASHDGFNYSDALKSKEGEWNLEKMDAWLENPNEFASGNRMTYPGVKDAQKRHNIIAYMLQQSENAGGN